MTKKAPSMMCASCRFRKFSEDDPTSLLGWFWVWHTKWCPGWKAYLKARKEHGEGPPELGSLRGLWEKRKDQ